MGGVEKSVSSVSLSRNNNNNKKRNLTLGGIATTGIDTVGTVLAAAGTVHQLHALISLRSVVAIGPLAFPLGMILLYNAAGR